MEGSKTKNSGTSKHTYYCVGCGTKCVTDREYPDNQWVCLKCRKLGVKVNVKCSVCGKEVPVSFDTFRLKKPDIPWRCRRCNDDYRNAVYDAKSDEEKKAFVEKQIANVKRYYANMSEEERKKDHERRVGVWDRLRENGEFEARIDKIHAGHDKWYANLSEEEKERRLNLLFNGRDERWNRLSAEEKKAEIDRLFQVARDYYDNASKEDLDNQLRGARDGVKRFWDEMTREKYFEWRVAINSTIKRLKDEGVERTDLRQPTDTEIEFMNLLNIHKIPFIFQYPSVQIHPEFDKKFPINTVTGGDHVDPTHMWDFKIPSKGVFIDLDGWIHRVKKDECEFNDSKRPYQTDGLRAYAIQCYDGTISLDNTVTDVVTGEKMNVSQLISLLKDDSLLK